jgi:hypothetical protein
MRFMQSLKETLDWGKRIQFIFQLVALLLSGSVVGAVRAMLTSWTHISEVWRVPIYCATAGVSLLVFGLLARWLLPSTSGNADRSGARRILDEVLRAGARAALYDYMRGRSKDLLRDLEEAWHAWDNAGEKLIHPLDATKNFIKGTSIADNDRLWNMQRDFMVLYHHHLLMMELFFPDFTSPIIEMGYPSSQGFPAIRTCLAQHAEELGHLSKKAWAEYGTPFES